MEVINKVYNIGNSLSSCITRCLCLLLLIALSSLAGRILLLFLRPDINRVQHSIVFVIDDIFEILLQAILKNGLEMISRNRTYTVAICFVCVLVVQDKTLTISGGNDFPPAVRRVDTDEAIVQEERRSLFPAKLG